ncbi:acetyltransferase domain-containing protein [Biscogniauxia sp. FL1348]|nr:acetyltransferase domain-containing protein [Biscogniauxia sp. FL1348]
MTTPEADKPVSSGQITAAAAATEAAEPEPKRTTAAASTTTVAASGRVRVRTTLPTQPFPPNASRQPIRTARLTLHPVSASAADVEGVHALRSQPEVMAFTAAGRPDRDLAETQAFLDRFLPPRDADTFNFVIRLQREGEGEGEGEVIGTGGVHSATGWPEVGYMFAREHWGKGYATEFLTACVQAWWALPRGRGEVEVEVDAASVGGAGEEEQVLVRRVPEMLTAMVEETNPNSAKVLRKVGFREFRRWTEPDSRESYGKRDITLIALAATSPGR